jgi:hypothetical protein
MTQQEAYIELSELLKQAEALMDQANELAREHKLVLASRERDGLPETINPKYLDGSSRYPRFRTDLTQDEVNEIMGDDYYSPEDIAGQDIYECWVPSQFC